jgi:hypothetical protein
MNQYYYARNDCPANSAKDRNCICWRDQGTGPYPDVTPDKPKPYAQGLEWRVKPDTVQNTVIEYWLQNDNTREGWGPFKSDSDAWRYYFGRENTIDERRKCIDIGIYVGKITKFV